MATDLSNDPRAFRDFLDSQLSGGSQGLTLEECLDRWDYENQTDEEREATLAAIRQGLADVEASRVRPFAEFDREFRQKHGLPPRA